MTIKSKTPKATEQSYKLPTPILPTMALPQRPVVPGVPDYGDQIRPGCDGEICSWPDIATSKVVPPPKGKARILIALAMLDVKMEFFESFMKFWTQLCVDQDKRYEVGYHIVYRKPAHMAEETLVNIALYNKCTHILFVDDDIYDITKAGLDKLFEADKDVISGLMYTRSFPHAACAFRRYDLSKKVIDAPSDNSIYRLYEIPCICSKCESPISHWDAKFCLNCGTPQDNLIQRVDLVPFCFTLMKTSIFSKIKQPWFHCSNKYPTDSWFADRLLEAGLNEYCHMGVRLNHCGVNDVTRDGYMQIGMSKGKVDNTVIPITPDQMEKHQYLLHTRMMEVERAQRPKIPIVGASTRGVVSTPPKTNKGESDVKETPSK